ncbi:MAG TPA: phosphomannomutase/phosphoglucomutase [Gammaproteobacteria bacterium]
MAFKLPKLKATRGRTAAAGKANAGAPGRLSFMHLGVLIFLLGASLVAGIAIFFQQDAAKQSTDSWRQEITLTAENLADRIATQIGQNAARMDLLTRDAQLIELVSLNDPALLAQRETELAYLFPNSVRVRLLPPGLTEVDMNATPPLSYAALDMLRQAETTETPPPAEVHLFGTPQQHINMVRRILSASGRRIIGHLMVSFPMPTIQEALDAPKLTRGYGEVWQVVEKGAPVVLAKRGASALRDGQPAVTVDIPGSRWKVAYWIETSGFTSSSEGLWAIAGSGIAIFGLLLALILRSFLRALRQDQTLILGAVRDARQGRMQADYALQLKECTGAIDGIRQLFQDGTAAPRVMGTAGAAASRAADAVQAQSPSQSPSQSSVLDNLSNVGLDLSAVGVSEIQIDPSIFRAYDIRGVVEQGLTPEVVYEIGRAIGSEAHARGEQSVIVGRDGRLSGPDLQDALMRGLRATGVHVKDIGPAPTPVLYFAAHTLDTRSGVMLTGSHNPPEYNGMKIVLAGETLSGMAIQRLRERIENGEFDSGNGQYEKVQIVDQYVERVRRDVQLAKPMKVVVDCGNGIAGMLAPKLLEDLGCRVIPLYCEVDGKFPHHHPDPSRPENLADLIRTVREQGADLGLAFDGDGDRLGVVGSEGEILWPDRLLMLFAMDILGRNPGAEIIYDVKCSRHLAKIIRDFGGSPEIWKTGHSLIKARMKETGALLAGEMSGHIFFKERWYGFDDAMYVGARLLEILSNDHRPSHKVFAALPDGFCTPELTLLLREGEPQRFMAEFLGTAQFPDAEILTIDGLRADFADGWGLVRASNTTPSLVMRFEADTEQALARIQDQFRTAMLAADPKLKLPF